MGKPTDMLLLLGLAGGSAMRTVADHAGVSTKTISRRLKDTEFAAELAELRGALIAEAMDAVAASMSEAAATLQALLRDQNAWVRLQAARDILALGLRPDSAAPAVPPQIVSYQLCVPDDGRARHDKGEKSCQL